MWSFYLDLSSGENDRLIARGKEEAKAGKGEEKTKKKNKKQRNFVVLPANEDATEDGKEGGVLFPSSSRKEKDRAAFVASLERQAGGAAGRGGGGVSSKFVAAIKAANSKGWVRSFGREGGREGGRGDYGCPCILSIRILYYGITAVTHHLPPSLPPPPRNRT